MNHSNRPAITGIIIAITITTAMDATGYSFFSALPLIPLTGLFWYLQRFSRQEIGLTWGDPTSYGWALAYPLCCAWAGCGQRVHCGRCRHE